MRACTHVRACTRTLNHYTSFPLTPYTEILSCLSLSFSISNPPPKPFISFSFPAQVSFCSTKFTNFHLTGISLLSNNPSMCSLVSFLSHFPVWLFSVTMLSKVPHLYMKTTASPICLKQQSFLLFSEIDPFLPKVNFSIYTRNLTTPY